MKQSFCGWQYIYIYIYILKQGKWKTLSRNIYFVGGPWSHSRPFAIFLTSAVESSYPQLDRFVIWDLIKVNQRLLSLQSSFQRNFPATCIFLWQNMQWYFVWYTSHWTCTNPLSHLQITKKWLPFSAHLCILIIISHIYIYIYIYVYIKGGRMGHSSMKKYIGGGPWSRSGTLAMF